MPDRIIRDELLDSERWVGLSDDTCKLAYVAILLRCDALGNYPADLFRLRRLWRDLQIGTDEIAAKRLNELADHGLVQLYEADGKRFLHIPRFRQRLRYVKRIYPMSPWTTDQEKQRLLENSPGAHQSKVGLSPDCHPTLTPEVKGSEVKGSEKKGKEKTLAPAPARSNPDANKPNPEPETPVDKIGNTIQHLTLTTRPPKTDEEKEADRARQLAYVWEKTKGKQ